MRYGIFGDVHSNLAALEAVLAAFQQEGVDRYLCLGDIVGYGADAQECVARVRALAPVIVAGNHDWAVGERLPLDFFNSHARAAITWTRRNVPRDDIEWLASLDLIRVEGDVTLAHSTVHDPAVFDYLQTPYDAYLSFRAMTTRDGFVGHSHIPVTFFDGTPITYAVGDAVRFAARRTISNVGSVGQPRDEDPRASFGVFDTDTRILEIRRVEYDVETTVARIRAAGLPPILADRLRLGR